MTMRKIRNDYHHNYVKYTFMALIIVIVGLSFGWASYNASLRVSLGALVRIKADIRITDFIVSSKTNEVTNSNEFYNTDFVSGSVNLPYSDSIITYKVDVTNMELAPGVHMGISSISSLPENLEIKKIEGYQIPNKICDNTNPSNCGTSAVKSFYITIGYKKQNGSYLYDEDNTNFNFVMNFKFKRVYDITYLNMNSDNYPSTVIENNNLEITFTAPYPTSVSVVGSNNYTYNTTTGILNIIKVKNDITITPAYASAVAYFKPYDGENHMFEISDFTNSTITQFVRNKTLTKEQVEALNNKYEVQNTLEDGYNNDMKIYAWLDGTTLNWWSEADNVYFHPNTTSAFMKWTNATFIDLSDTNTSLVKNFSHWFDKDAVLTEIKGKIITSGLEIVNNCEGFNHSTDVLNNNNNSSKQGLAFMFNDCKKLTSVDLSGFDTTNACDMKRMFANCSVLNNIDVSHFNTSNVRSTFWMFRNVKTLTNINLSNFDTSNVINMTGMFYSASNLKTITLGENFNTNNVARMDYMFYQNTALTTIYVEKDFDKSSLVSSGNMFTGDTKLVGNDGEYNFPFTSSSTNSQYANYAIAPNTDYPDGKPGYFTKISDETTFTILYELNGGKANNPTIYYTNQDNIKLTRPTKEGCVFLGWTGSNGDVPELDVTIPSGSYGNKQYVAHFTHSSDDQTMKLLFNIDGSCIFNGSQGKITTPSDSSCINNANGNNIDYASEDYNEKYIDTGVKLFGNDTYMKDFELYFELTEYDPNNQESGTQQTIVNSKNENGTTSAPGFVFRRATNGFELKESINNQNVQYNPSASTFQNLKLIRVNDNVYYSINGGKYVFFQSTKDFNQQFEKSVWFGSSFDQNNNPMRHIKATISKMYIKREI